jgi:hypothetical protein
LNSGPHSNVSTTPEYEASSSCIVMTRGPAGRVVQVGLLAVEPLEHEEVVEVPEEDGRELQVEQLLERSYL